MDDVEPVQQVVAEAAFADERLEVAVGGGDHARAGAAHGAGAEQAELAAVEHAQQLGLAGERQLADLVEEEAARARELEQALAVRARAGEGAALVPKSSLSTSSPSSRPQLTGTRPRPRAGSSGAAPRPPPPCRRRSRR